MRIRSDIYSRYFTRIKLITKYPIIKNYAPAVFTLLTISVLTLFAIKPTVETILVLQKELENEEEVLRKVMQKANDLSLGKENYDNLDQNIKFRIMNAVPDNINLKTVIQILEESAKIHNASVSALQIQPFIVEAEKTDQIGTLSEVSFLFNTEGDYNNLIALLSDLKKSSRLMSIDGLSMSKSNEGTSLIMSLTGKAYYLK